MKAELDVLRKPQGTKSITENGTVNVAEYEFASVAVPPPSGYADVTGVTAAAADVRSGKKFVTAAGALTNGSYVYNPFGDDAELIATYQKETFVLKDTSFNGWTPSTTAKTIQSSANYGTVDADMDQYEYFTKIMCDAKIAYADGTTLSGAMVRQITELFQYMYRKPNSLSTIASVTDNYNYCTTMFTVPFMEYWNTGSPPVHTMTYTGSYGFYPTAASHSFSSSTSTTPTITIKRPSLNARCHNTYMTTAMAGAVDQDNSKIEVWGFLYRCKKGSAGWAVWRDFLAAYNA